MGMIRISGGNDRGRRLKVPAGDRIRPTSDKVKQALFNILGKQVEGARFLDLFAGAGGIGLEALSRGALQVVFVDSSARSLAVVRQNIEALGCADRAIVISTTADRFLKKPLGTYDVIFVDPPYRMELTPLLEAIARTGLLRRDGVLIAEHFKKQPTPGHADGLLRYRETSYGDTALAFYRMPGAGLEGNEKG